MKYFSTARIAAGLAASCLVAGSQALSPASPLSAHGRLEPLAEISGLAVSAHTGEPLKGVLVSLRPGGKEQTDEGPLISSVTGLDGRFLFSKLEAGTYELWMSKSGYAPRFNARRIVRLGERLKLAGLVTKLWRSAVITGRVAGLEGDPIPEADVRAYRLTYQEGILLPKLEAAASSDDLGEYRIFDLPAGKYVVCASRIQQEMPPGALQYEYATACYPNTSDLSAAATLKLAWADEAAGTDFQLSPAPRTALVGVTHDEATGGACGACVVRVQRIDAMGSAAWGRSLRVRPDGGFVIHGLVPGQYRLTSETGGVDSRVVVRRLPVSTETIEEVVLVATAGQTVTGSVVLEESSLADASGAADSQQMTVHLTPEPGSPSRIARFAPISLERGTFTIENVPPGTYRLRLASLSPGGYLKSLALAGRRLPEPKLVVGESPVPELTLHIGFDSATVNGIIRVERPANSNGPARAVVALLPRSAAKGYLRETYTRPGEDGRFGLTDLPPGDYTLFAVPARDSFDLGDPEVRHMLQEFGREVDLAPEKRVTVELVTIPEQ